MILLKLGSRGSDVRIVQRKLNLAEDGIFGAKTEESVKKFQQANGLMPDGIVGAETWNALSNVLKKSVRKIDYIIVHCSATKEGEEVSVEDIRKWHKQRGWSDIGYHYVIYLNGERHNGRDVDLIGAHARNFNSNSIGVVYVGGLDKSGRAKDTRTQAQKESLLKLLKELRVIYPSAKIIGHYDTSKDKNGNGIIDDWEKIKECPCFNAKEEYEDI